MNILVQKMLVVLVVGVAVISSYFWIYPLTRKVVDRGRLEEGENFLEYLGKEIILAASLGGKRIIDVYVPGEIRIRDDYIELKIKTKYPLISQRDFLPLNTNILPLEKEKINLIPYTSRNCTQVNCSWCLDKDCNLSDVRIGNFSEERFAIFWIYDRYGAVCFTNDTLDDGYLEIDENYCYYEGEYYKSYNVFLIDEVGDYVILEGQVRRAKVISGEERIVVVGRTVGERGYITELRLYILDTVDKTGKKNEIIIACRRNCWKTEGRRIITTELERIIVEEGTIKKFINIEIS